MLDMDPKEIHDRIKSGSRFQRMTNKAISICVVTFISYIIIVLNNMEQECHPGTAEFCLDLYLEEGGYPHPGYLLDTCGHLRAGCSHSGLASDLNYANTLLSSTSKGDQLLVATYNTTIGYCLCLLYINDDLNGFNDSPASLTCDFLYSRAIFFVVGVVIAALLDYCTLEEDTDLGPHSGNRIVFFFGRLFCILLCLVYFLFASMWYDSRVNSSIKCTSETYDEVAKIAQTIGVISLLCGAFFILLFELPTFIFLGQVTKPI